MSKKYDREKIGEIVQKITELKLSYIDGAEQFGIPVRDIYRYNHESKKTNAQGTTASCDHQTCINSSNYADEEKNEQDTISSLPSDVQTAIIKYRQENPDHGYRKIEDYLQDQYFVKVQRKQIRKLLKAHGLDKTLDSSFDRDAIPAKGTRRFEAASAKEFYQMDISYVYIEKLPVCYLILIIDDYSRFCVGYQLAHDQKSLTMINALHQSIERYGKPQKLLTDQGRSFYSWSFEETLFQKYLGDMKIEHIVSDPHSPHSQGKVERMTQTIQKELLHKVRFTGYEHAQSELESYIHRYNYRRPHQGINGMCPSDRFYGIADESAETESALLASNIDLSKGYLILKDSYRTLSVTFSEKTMQVFLDGVLLK